MLPSKLVPLLHGASRACLVLTPRTKREHAFCAVIVGLLGLLAREPKPEAATMPTPQTPIIINNNITQTQTANAQKP